MTFLRKDPMPTLFLASVLLAATIVARALSIGLEPWEIARLWPFILLCPAALGFYRLVVARLVRLRARLAEAPHSEDAERSSRTVRTVARRYLVGAGLVVLFLQAQWLAGSYGLHLDHEVMTRGVFLVLGALMAYFGNVIPKIAPMNRDRDPAAYRRATRLIGWVMVIEGALVCLAAITLRLDTIAAIMPAAIGAMALALVLAVFAQRLLKLVKGG